MSAFPLVASTEQVNCYRCGVLFASPILAKRRNDGESFYCPNGHSQHFTKTEAMRLNEELERVKRELGFRQRDLEWEKSQRQTAEKGLSAQKGLTTKARKKLARVHCGVCPECNRSFGNLAAHMKTKHTRKP